ncbi:DUF6479 family protein [Streptomyces sanyensis]|uniref:Secreted protein n=1 Tax=Streptomyces sanyensis TaxID=568869 RepID=A0ABP9B9L5_9ACTN
MTAFLTSRQHTAADLAADGAPAVIVFLLIVVGLLVLLVYVVWQVGARRRRDTAPTREELPTPPEHQSHVESRFEPDEVDGTQGHVVPGRLTPHELHGYGNMGGRPSAEEPPAPPREPGDDRGARGGSGA